MDCGGRVGDGVVSFFPPLNASQQQKRACPVREGGSGGTKADTGVRFFAGGEQRGPPWNGDALPSPAEAAAIATAALAASFPSTPSSDDDGGDPEEWTPRGASGWEPTHSVYSHQPSAESGGGGGGMACDCGGSGGGGSSGGGAGAGAGRGSLKERLAAMESLEQDLRKRARNLKRMREMMAASSSPVAGGEGFPSPPQYSAQLSRERYGADGAAPGLLPPTPGSAGIGGLPVTLARSAVTLGRPVSSRANPCRHPGCTRGASFGHKGGGRKGVLCAEHKQAGMVKVTTRQCADSDCTTAPSYGFRGKKASFCSKHKMQGMINVVSPRCQHAGCSSCASYGLLGDRRPLFCARHAQDGMSNVVSRKCLGAGCAKTPSYGNPGDRRPSFCISHHLPGMSNIVSPKCAATNCGKTPSFGMDGDRKATFCKRHKHAGMVNMVYAKHSRIAP